MASNAVQLGLGALAAAAVGVAVIAIFPGPEQEEAEPPSVADAGAIAPAVEEASQEAETPEVTPQEIELTETEPEDPVEEPQVAEVEPPAPTIPSIDHFSMSPDGFGTVSGKADPTQVVAVLVSGEAVTRTRADDRGNFAAVLVLDPSPQPRRLTLLADPDGARIASEGQFFVQPIVAAVAEAEEAPAEEEAVDTPVVVGAVTPVEVEEAPEIAEAEPEPEAAVEADEDPVEVVVAEPETETVPEPVAVAEATQDPVVEPTPEPVAETEPTPEPVAETPTVIVADADGVRVVQDARGPEVMSAIALDTITYDPAGEVTLAGRAVGEGFVRVYVDNRPVTTSRITEGGWQTDLPEVDTGVYTLRIDEVDAEGTVVSRIETPFKREEPEAVAAVMSEDTEKEGFDVAVRTVQPGATLWAIAQEEMGEGVMYVAVYEANRDLIKDPDLIFPGQVFRIPQADQ